MKVLAFDTSLGGCSVAVVDTVTGAATSDVQPMARGQSEVLVPIVQSVIEKSGIPFEQIDLIVTTVGPGAFTGLRIGLSTARSFGLALDKPVDGILTTEASAAGFFNQNKELEKNLLVVIETKRDDFYAQSFSKEIKAIDDASALPVETLLANYQGFELNVCGDGCGRLREELGKNWPENWTLFEHYDLIDPEVMAVLAAAAHENGNARPADPVYLRGADVSLSNKVQRTIAGQ